MIKKKRKWLSLLRHWNRSYDETFLLPTFRTWRNNTLEDSPLVFSTVNVHESPPRFHVRRISKKVELPVHRYSSSLLCSPIQYSSAHETKDHSLPSNRLSALWCTSEFVYPFPSLFFLITHLRNVRCNKSPTRVDWTNKILLTNGIKVDFIV